MGQELGYYSAGTTLQVSLQEFAGGAKSLEALLGGSVDVVCGFYDHTIQMAAAGRNLVSFVLLLKRPCLSLVSRAAKSITDLRGKIVGVTAPGSSSHMLLNYMTARAGLRKDDLSIVGIGTGASAVAAITSGKVEAAMMTEPARSFARKRSPGLRTLVDSTSMEGCRAMCGSDTYPSACLYANADWLANSGDTPRQLASALLRTIRWMQSHSAAETEQKVPAELRAENSEIYREGLATVVPVYSGDGILSAEAPETVLRVLSASLPELRKPSFDLTKTYTNEYVRHLDL